MAFQSNVIESQATNSGDGLAQTRRRAHRQKIRTLVQVNLESATGGILRDLSEFGIAVQTVAPFTLNQQIHLRFDLPAPRVRFEATGRVAWTDSWGQAGVEFVDLPPGSERLLKEWIFSQILSAAYLFAPCESSAVEGNHAEGATELLFSASPRPVIRIEPAQTSPPVLRDQDAPARNVRLPWCPVPMSLHILAKLLDGLVLLCAVLLFAVMAMAITSILLSWPIALALACGVTAVFVALYWFLFVFWIGSTPGEHLARLACSEPDFRQEERSRFR